MRRAACLVSLGGLVALCAAPGVAVAAVAIGQPSPVIPTPCGDDKPFVPHAIASGSSYSPPSHGVITSWTMRADSAANRTAKLLVLKPDPTSAGRYIAVQKDIVRTLTMVSQLNTFTGMRLPIEPDERIGLYIPDGQPGNQSPCAFSTLNANDLLGSPGASGDPALGVSVSYGDQEPNTRLNAGAVVEPDADCDGFGDETQDPAVDRRCLAEVVRATAKGRKLRVELACRLATRPCSENRVVLRTATKINLDNRAVSSKAKRVTLGKGTFSLTAGRTQIVSLRLGRSARRVFEERGKLRSQVTVSAASESASASLTVKRR